MGSALRLLCPEVTTCQILPLSPAVSRLQNKRILEDLAHRFGSGIVS
jgi:hypothetical protein